MRKEMVILGLGLSMLFTGAWMTMGLGPAFLFSGTILIVMSPLAIAFFDK